MKILIKSLLLLSVGFLLSPVTVGYAKRITRKRPVMHLAWMDDFNSEKLDTAVWAYMLRGKDGSRRYLTPDSSCYEIKEGILRLKGIVNDNLNNDTATYLTGGLYTKGKKSFADGRIEIRARFKPSQGAWPALWLLPFKNEKGWPADGEIDIMEHLNYDGFVYQSVHTAYTKRDKFAPPKRSVRQEIDINSFNTYAVDMLADSIVFYVNGAKTLAYPKVDSLYSEGQFPFDRAWYLLMNMQLGGSWAGSVDKSTLPAVMEIDWVKFYKKQEDENQGTHK